VRMQCREARRIARRIQIGSQGLFQQNHLVCCQGLQHPLGLIHGPTAVGIHLQFHRQPLPLGPLRDGLGHRLEQAPVVVQPIGTAQLELHPRRRQLGPPAVQTIQH